MYKHQITVELSDDVVHHYSIMEWEAILLRTTAVHQDDLPLSYGRIAEVLAEEYHKYGGHYFSHEYGNGEAIGLMVKEATETTYTNVNGFTTNVKMRPVTDNAAHLDPAGTMLIGIANYRNIQRD